MLTSPNPSRSRSRTAKISVGAAMAVGGAALAVTLASPASAATATKLINLAPARVANGQVPTLTAKLVRADNGAGIGGRPVTLTLNGKSCVDAATDGAGVASCALVNPVAAPAAATSVAMSASHSGNAVYGPATASRSVALTVFKGRAQAMTLNVFGAGVTNVADTGAISRSTAATNPISVGAGAVPPFVVWGSAASRVTTSIITRSTQTQTSSSAVTFNAGPVSMRANAVGIDAMARCGLAPGASVTVGGVSLNGAALPANPAPNTVYPTLLPGVTVILNEQIITNAATTKAITVNAVRVTVAGIAEWRVGHAEASAVNCP